MTKLLYAINEAEEYNIDLHHTYRLDIIAKNIIKVTEQFFKDLPTDTMTNEYDDDDIKTSKILDIITKTLSDNNADIEIDAHDDDSSIAFEKRGKDIYFNIIVFGSTNYYYEVKTIDLDADEDLIFL